MTKISILQKKAIRYLHKAYNNHPTTTIFKNSETLRINELYQLEVGKFMYDVINKLIPPAILLMFTPTSDIHEHNTRHQSGIHIVPHRTKVAYKTILHQGPNNWSGIRESIKNSKTKKIFSFHLKKCIFETNI